MARQSPYLQRRGDAFCFRIAVPHDLRLRIGSRELNKSLNTSDKQVAVPRALTLAAQAKKLFCELRSMASETAHSDPQFVVDLDAERARLLSDLHSLLDRQETINTRRDSVAAALRRLCEESAHLRDLGQKVVAACDWANARAIVGQLRELDDLVDRLTPEALAVATDFASLDVLAGQILSMAQGWSLSKLHHETIADREQVVLKERQLLAEFAALTMKAGMAGLPETSSLTQPKSIAPLLSVVIQEFLDKYQQDKKPAMFAKHQSCLPMFLQVVGDKPVSDLKQGDINKFFDVLQRLPPRWRDEAKRRRMSILELAAVNHDVKIGPKTFEDTYKACLRAFLITAKKDWQDQGFPTTLTTDGAAYKGDRKEGEDKQRAFEPAELKRLFEGSEMAVFAGDKTLAHCYWLPHLGLFTGARVNELCQLNPQTDLLDEGGDAYLWITEDTDGDNRIDKKTKNEMSKRKVPIHSKLLELGFLDYVARVRKAGGKLLFPEWKPSKGRASPAAEKWFRGFLTDIGLRDETPGRRIVGMHAFRHTLLNRALNAGVDVTTITGHAGDVSAVVRGYQGELSLKNKRISLEAIDYQLAFIPPVGGASRG